MSTVLPCGLSLACWFEIIPKRDRVTYRQVNLTGRTRSLYVNFQFVTPWASVRCDLPSKLAQSRERAIIMPVNNVSMQKDMPLTVLSVDSILSKPFKTMLLAIGITFNADIKARFLFYFCIFELIKHSIATIVGNYINRRSLIASSTDLSIHLIPLIVYIDLKLHLRNLNNNFNAFLAEFAPCERHERIHLVKTIRQLNSLCCVLIFVQYVSLYSVAIGSFERKRGWAVNLTIPIDLGLNRTVEIVIVIIACLHNTLVSNFIPITVSLYLFYLKLLLKCKIIILKHMNPRDDVFFMHRKLNALDDLTSSFEKILSVVPLTWLYYCIGPGLIFMYSLAGLTSKNGSKRPGAEAICYLVYQINNMIITLASLLLISKWQEKTRDSVDSVTRKIKATAHLPIHFGLLCRIQEVMMRPVTVWLICPIDRSLIAAFCGSAITFSTLFIQLQSNP